MNPANAAFFPILVNGTNTPPQVGDTFVIEDLITVSAGPLSLQYIQGGSTSTSAARIVFGEIAFRSNSVGMTLFTPGHSGVALNCYSCDFNVSLTCSATSFGIMTNNRYRSMVGISGPIELQAGLVNDAAAVGIEVYQNGIVGLTQGFMCQGASIKGANLLIVDAAIFDVASSGVNPGGHAITIGFGRSLAYGARSVCNASIQTRVWGNGNAGVGLNIEACCQVQYTAGIVASLTVTGTGGDFRLNGKTTSNVWDQTANAGAGAWLVPRNCTWANLAAAIGAAGLGGFANDVESGARIASAV